MTVALKDTDVKVDFRYFPEESTWYQMNGNEKVQVVKLKVKKYIPIFRTTKYWYSMKIP